MRQSMVRSVKGLMEGSVRGSMEGSMKGLARGLMGELMKELTEWRNVSVPAEWKREKWCAVMCVRDGPNLGVLA